MKFIACIPCGVLVLSICSLLLSGCTTAESESSLRTNNLNGNNVVYDAATQSFFVALGAEGYAKCGSDLSCKVEKVEMSVDDLAVADGLVFLLDATSGWLAVVQVDGTVVEKKQVNTLPFNGVSAAGGRVVVSGGIHGLDSFRYSDTGALTPENSGAKFASGQPDVYQPNGELAFITTDFEGEIQDTKGIDRFGIRVAALPNLDVVNLIGLHDDVPFLEAFELNINANFPLVSTSYKKKDQGLCLVAASPNAGLVVVCNPDCPSNQRRFDIAETKDARSVAVGGERAFLVSLVSGDLRLTTFDLAPLDSNSAPVLLCSKVLAHDVSLPVSVAASADGRQALIAASKTGLILSQDFECN